MTETELSMPVNFDKTHFLILSPNPTVAAKVVVAMTSSSWWYD